MANTLRFKRGLASGIPTGVAGEPLFTTDTFDLYIGNGTSNTRFQKYIASGTTSQLLRGDGSLYTFPLAISSPTNGQVLKYNGTSWVNDSDAGITGSASAGQVAYFTGATTQAGSNNLFWDNTNGRLGIGITTPSNKLEVRGDARNPIIIGGRGAGSTYGPYSYLGFNVNIDALTYSILGAGRGGAVIETAAAGAGLSTWGVSLYSPTLTSEGTLLLNNSKWSFNGTAMTLYATGNLGINTASDNGLKLQVNGTGYFSGSVGIGSTSLTGTNLRISKTITGSTSPISLYIDGVIQSDATNTPTVFGSTIGTQAASFSIANIRHFSASQGTFGAGSSVTNQYGYWADSGLVGATNNYGFYGNIAAATGRWNLYMNGTAANFLSGNTQIGTGALTSEKLQVNGTMKVTGASTFARITATTSSITLDYNSGILYHFGGSGNYYQFINGANYSLYNRTTTGALIFGTNQLERMRLDASGNLGLGVTPSAWANGVKAMEVLSNGNAIVSGAATQIISTANAYFDGAWKYGTTGVASYYQQINAVHSWHNAISGSANAAITFTQAMTLDASGNLAVGTTTTTNRLEVWGSGNTAARIVGQSAGNATLILSSGGVTAYSIKSGNGDSSLRIDQDGSERIMLASGGDVLIGSTSNSGEKLQVTGTAKITGNFTGGAIVSAATEFRLNNATFGRIAKLDGSGGFAGGYNLDYSSGGVVTHAATGTIAGIRYETGGNILFYTNTSQSAGTTASARMTLDSSGNLGIGISPSYKLDVSGSARVSDAIAIGTTPDTNNPFKILKNLNTTVGIKFENTNTSSLAFSAVQLGTDITGGTAFTNLVYGSSGISEAGVFKPSGTALINTGSGGLNFLAVSQPIRFFTSTGNGTLRASITNDGDFTQFNGTNPSASTTDAFRMYSADVVAGNAAAHFRTENGAVIKLYQETTSVGNAIFSAGGGTGVLDDSTFDGYTLRQIVKALRNQGILA
jgi:hypothetical protein